MTSEWCHTIAETDWRGNFVLSSQVQSTARDLARFGLLLLQDGMWNGERILPAGWVAYARTPAPARTGLDSEADRVFFRADRFVADVIEALR